MYLSVSLTHSILIDSSSQAAPFPAPSWPIMILENLLQNSNFKNITILMVLSDLNRNSRIEKPNYHRKTYTIPTFLASTSNISVRPLSNKFVLLSKLTLLLRLNFEVVPFLPNISKLTLLSVDASEELPVLIVILYFTFR